MWLLFEFYLSTDIDNIKLEEEGFITSRQGKGFFVMSSSSNLIREQLIQEVEKILNSAILAAERSFYDR